MASAWQDTMIHNNGMHTRKDASRASTHRYSPFPARVQRSMPAERRAPQAAPVASSSTSRPQGVKETQIFCNSKNISMGACTVNNIGRDMIFYGNDPVELRQILSEFRAIAKAIPPVVGYMSANALVMTDALGETMTIPWSLVPTYEDLHRALVTHFTSKIGEHRVSSRRYCIAQAGGGEGAIITPDNWNRIRERNVRLVMSMLIEQVLDEELRNMCPKCGRTELGTYRDGGWHVCRRCNTRFLLPGKPESRPAPVHKGMDREDFSFRHVRKCECFVPGTASSFPQVAKSAQNIEVLAAWRSITSNPKFRDIVDISALCSEFTARARCDGTKVVLPPAAVDSIIQKMQHGCVEESLSAT